MLDKFDPTNDRPAVVLKKETIMLNYFTQSIMHRMFSLADLKKGENLDSIRANFTQGNIIVFDADSLIRRLLELHPGDKELLAGHTRYHAALLDDYPTDVWEMYLDSACLVWLSADRENASACYQLGLHHLLNEDYTKAEHFFQQAIASCDTHYRAHYNLGITQFYLEKPTPAISHLRRACNGYSRVSEKADAARVIGIIYDDYLNNADSALHYLQAAVTTDASYLNQAFLLQHYLKQKSPLIPQQLERCWETALNDEESFSSMQDMLWRCMDNGQSEAITQFLKRRNDEATSDYEHGVCCLFLGNSLADNPTEAISWLEKSIKYIESEAPDEFIANIRQMIEELQKK